MRTTIGDVVRHPSHLSEWWLEPPLRRNILRRAYWGWLLFEPGQGWLRWGTDTAWTYPLSWLDPPEPYGIAPPLRRIAMAIKYMNRWPLTMRQEDRRLHRAW